MMQNPHFYQNFSINHTYIYMFIRYKISKRSLFHLSAKHIEQFISLIAHFHSFNFQIFQGWHRIDSHSRCIHFGDVVIKQKTDNFHADIDDIQGSVELAQQRGQFSINSVFSTKLMTCWVYSFSLTTLPSTSSAPSSTLKYFKNYTTILYSYFSTDFMSSARVR